MLHKYLFIFLFLTVLFERSLCDCQDNVCSLPLEQGRCRASIDRYGYDGAKCRMFTWGGCDSNGNNFETMEECQEACGTRSDV